MGDWGLRSTGILQHIAGWLVPRAKNNVSFYYNHSDLNSNTRYSQLSCSNLRQTLVANCGTSVFASKELYKPSVNSEQTKRPSVTPNERRTKDRTTNRTDQIPLWKPIWSSAAQEIPCILREHKIIYNVDNSQPLFPVLKTENRTQFKFSYFLKTHFNIILPPTPIFQSGLTTSGLPTKKKVM
jgi:hypothetical protein